MILVQFYLEDSNMGLRCCTLAATSLAERLRQSCSYILANKMETGSSCISSGICASICWRITELIMELGGCITPIIGGIG